MFAFNLQPVLNYRKTVEEKKLTEFADMQRKLVEEKKLLESICKEKQQIVEQLKNIQQSTFYASDVSFSLAYVGILSEKELIQQKVVARVAVEVERLRRELLETVKDRKMIDIIKEHKLAEFKMGIATLERKAIEETAIQSFARKNK
ncbi:MAG: flagellar export protein FliJ [Syntrophales bacterium]|jgi:flagellar FliJ protein|nr:flagellar export protein FliJ [Syntrophales bacterium]